MAYYYSRPKSKYLWIKWYDESGEPQFRSTDKLVRADGTITPCLKDTRDGERTAKHICEEIEAAKKLKIAKSIFKPVPKENYVSIADAFERFKQLNKYKDRKTVYEHERFFRVFTKTFPANSPCNDITQEAIEDWLLSVRELKTSKGETIKQNTVFNYQKNIKKFLTYMFEKKLIKIPFVISRDVQVKQIAGRKLIFRDEHIHKIMEGLDKKGSNFKTCVYLLAYTGLRPSDIVNIPVDKIDFKRKTFEYYSQKGKEYRTIPIPRQIISIFQKRVAEVKTGNLLEYSRYDAITKAFNRYIKEDLKLEEKYSPRTFRKSYDTWAYENGMDIVANSRLVGHSIITAERNYRDVNMKTLRTEQDKFKLPNKPKSRKNSDTK